MRSPSLFALIFSITTMTPPSQNDRLDNTTTNLPICYGSIAFYLGPQSDEYHTHKWTLYLRSPDPTFDLSKAISKVVFQLHPSFSVPTRELTSPPFEVTESGWGEFEASMRVVWREEAEERSAIVSFVRLIISIRLCAFSLC